MPCRGEYMNATAAEKENKRVCGFIVWLSGHRGLIDTLPPAIIEGANEYYGSAISNNTVTADLCKMLDASDAEVYAPDAIRDSTARKLAEWWEKHQEQDEKRNGAAFQAKEERRKQYLKLRSEFEEGRNDD